MAIDRVKQLLPVQLPGPQPVGLLFAGSVLLKGISLFRKFRLYRNPVNAAALGVGHAIEVVAGGKPGVKEIARFVFLALSIVKCAEDLIELQRHFSELKGHLTGRAFVFMRKDPSFEMKNWSSIGPRFESSWLWFRKVGMERVRLSALLVASIARRIGSLALHMGDAQAALTEDHVSAVVIHGHLLWKKLTANDAILIKKLQAMQGQTDAMMKVLKLPFSAEIFIKILMVPAEVKAKLPDLADIKKGLKKVIDLGKIHVMGTLEELRGVDPSLRKYQLDPRGMDAFTLKVIKPPIRVAN